jgi:hypothetical protein
MELEDGPTQALARAVDAVVKELGLPCPSDEQVKAALAAAADYAAPPPKQDARARARRRRHEGRDGQGPALLRPAARGRPHTRARPAPRRAQRAARRAYVLGRLVQQKRVAGRSHVTLAHTAELASPGRQAL